MEDRLTFGKQMCLFNIFTTLGVGLCQNHCPYPNWWIKQANMPQASQFTAWCEAASMCPSLPWDAGMPVAQVCAVFWKAGEK